MKEAREGRVEWLDLDVDTFVRFAKFAYSGNYTPAEPELIAPDDAVVLAPGEQDGKTLDGENVEEDEDEDEETDSSDTDDDDSSDSSEGSDTDGPIEILSDDQETSEYSSSSEDSSTLDNGGDEHLNRRPIDVSIDEHGMIHSYTSLPYSLENYMAEWEKCLDYRYIKHPDLPPNKRRRDETDFGRIPPRPVNKKYEAMCIFIHPMYDPAPREAPRSGVNTNPHESYRPVFLSHARLYILADKYGVNRLRRLVLARLHRTLTHYVVHRDRISDLIALAQEIFDNTMEMDHARSLIVNYLVCFIEDIQDSPELEDALRRGGDFPALLVSKMARRRI